MFGVEVMADGVNSIDLIVSSGYVGIDAEVGYVLTGTLLDEQFKVFLCMEREDLSVGITETILDEGAEAVGVIDDRSQTVHLLQEVGVQFGLVFADTGVCHCAFGFNDRIRFEVFGE